MIERDYLMRMIAQLAAVLAKILFAKKSQNYAEALLLTQNAYAQLLGLNGELVEKMEAATLTLLLGDKEKIKALATLLQEEGEVLHLQGKFAESKAKDEKALALFQEALRRYPAGDTECDAAIAALQSKLSEGM